MEFRPEDVAKLVLGYLKEEKCQVAFQKFLNSSAYLEECAQNYRKGRYIVTRVGGHNLMDYLSEYAAIYTIVQGRLEASEFYNDKRNIRTTLVQQLLYLLDNEIYIESRTSTPVPIDCKCHKTNSNTYVPSSSDKSLDTPRTEVNATSFECLPGNNNVTPSLNRTKDKSFNTSIQVHKSTNTDNVDSRDKSQDRCDISEEIFTHTFLENAELHEKLAENINKELSSSSEDKNSFTCAQQELDSAIRTIIQRTEQDPIFEKLIGEIIGPTELVEDETNRNPCDIPEAKELRKHTASSCLRKSQSTDNITRLYHSNKKVSPPNSSIEDQNNEAVNSIVAASLNDKQGIIKEPNITINTNPSPDGLITAEMNINSIQQNISAAGPNVPNQMYVNAGGLLMLQPNNTPQSSNILTSRNLQIFNNQPYITNPQTPFKMGTILTEQDILTMPTIFVCDGNQVANMQTVVFPSAVNNMSQSGMKGTVPRQATDAAQSLSEFITLYNCNDSFEKSSSNIAQPQPQSSHTDSKRKSKKKPSKKRGNQSQHQESQKVLKLDATTSSMVTVPVSGETETPENALITSSAEQESHQDQEITKTVPAPVSLPSLLTPKTSDMRETRSRSTPSSGSHVRQLNFSTPLKKLTLVQKENISKVEDSREIQGTPSRACKTDSTKVRNNLFKSPEEEEEVAAAAIATNNNNNTEETGNKIETPDSVNLNKPLEADSNQYSKSVNRSGLNRSWDADLRVLAARSNSPPKNKSRRQKRKYSDSPKGVTTKKRKVSLTVNKIEESTDLNKTEDDALLIEKALSEIDNAKESPPAISTSKKSNKSSSKKSARKSNPRSSNKKSSKSNNKSKKGASSSRSSKAKNTEKQTTPSDVPTITTDNAHPTETENLNKEDLEQVEFEQNILETTATIINRNSKAKIKRKCNIDNQVKKFCTSEEIVLTNVTKIKSCEILDDSKNKMILSPSKLNANKRNLVDVESKSCSNEVVTHTEPTFPEPVTAIKETTSESMMSVKPAASMASRNIMHLLETPVKFDTNSKNPISFTSPAIDTPFTKAVIEQLSGVDIGSVPTPKFPITPNFPFTPAIHEQSPFSNRGTDYSTSSSYYQPSDTEQSKSMEQLIEECRRLESGATTTVEAKQSPQEGKTDKENDKSLKKACKESTDLNTKAQISEVTDELKTNEEITLEVTDNTSSLIEKVKAFNQSLVGKKNLQLVRMISNDNHSSSESSSSESETSSSSDDDEDQDTSCSDHSVIVAEKTIQEAASTERYSFRPRKNLTKSFVGPEAKKPAEGTETKDVKKSEKVEVKESGQSIEKSETKESESIEKIEPKEPEQSTEKTAASNSENKVLQTFQNGLLQEMEEKRRRTIAKFKNASGSTEPKTVANKSQVARTKNGKIVKPVEKKPPPLKPKTPLNNRATLIKRKNSPVKSNKKLPVGTTKEQLKLVASKNQTQPIISTSITNIDLKEAKAIIDHDQQVVLHLSSDDENLEPFEMVETELLEYSSSSTPVIVEETKKKKEIINIDTQSLQALRSSLIKNKGSLADQQSGEEMIDQEAETLVKGLKQWGIHLIPNKKSKADLAAKKKTNSNDEQPLKKCTEEIQTKSHIKNKKDEEKKKEEKPLEKANISIEEGELVSDTDPSPTLTKSDSVEQSKVLSKLQNTHIKLLSELKAIDQKSSKESKPQSHSQTRSKESKQSTSKSASKTSKIVTGKSKSTSSKSLNKPKPENNKAIIQNETVNVLNGDVHFHVKTYDKETVRLTYDNSKKTNRTLKDYNLDILRKSLSANVYIAEIDAEVKKVMSVTPFRVLLDIPSKILSSSQKNLTSSKPSSSASTKPKKTPLTILYNQIIKPAPAIQNKSPLDNLYSPEPSTSQHKTSYPEKLNSSSDQNKKRRKSEHKSGSKERSSERSKSSIKTKSKSSERVTSKKLDRSSSKSRDDTGEVQNAKSRKLVLEGSATPTVEQSKSASVILSETSINSERRAASNLEVVNGVVMLNPVYRDRQDNTETNDELMNYAIVGSERIENPEDCLSFDNRKRRPSETSEAEKQQGKKLKSEGCQELLRNIDVDSFLKQLHGDT